MGQEPELPDYGKMSKTEVLKDFFGGPARDTDVPADRSVHADIGKPGMLTESQDPDTPCNFWSEEEVIFTLMDNPSTINQIGELRPEHFYFDNMDKLFAAVVAHIERHNGSADWVQFIAEIKQEPWFATVGNDEHQGQAYFAYHIGIRWQRGPLSINGGIDVGPAARAVTYFWRQREIQKANDAFNEEARSSRDLVTAQNRHMARVHQITQAIGIEHQAELIEAVDHALDRADDAFKRGGVPAGLLTGMPIVDAKMEGLEAGTLNVLAGRPSSGKTSLGMQWAVHLALHDVPVLVFSLETTEAALGRRILSMRSGVPLWHLKLGRHAQHEAVLMRARQELFGAKLTIDDSSGLTMADILARSIAHQRKHGLGLIVVDHLHIVRPDPADTRQSPTYSIGRISGGMKQLAKRLDVPVLLLAQLSRANTQREDKRPQLSDLRWSGDIEQDADVVAFIHRPEMYLGKTEPDQDPHENDEKYAARVQQWKRSVETLAGKAELILAKLRDGEPDSISLLFNGPTTSFAEAIPYAP